MSATDSAEDERLAALDRYDVLDTPSEEGFDRIARLARKIFDVPIATVSLIDAHRQWHKSREGLPDSEVPRQETFCNETIKGDRPMIIPDARRDPRFGTNPAVAEGQVRFYAGVPLRTLDGHNIGTLCAADTEPHEFGPEQVEILSDLARMAMSELELRRLATSDALTGALARNAFKAEAARQAALALRHHHALSALAFDLDHFKEINDTHGHPVGDLVLAKAAAACRGELRRSDLLGRIGGEEFAVLLPHTDLAGGTEVAEKLRAAIAATRLDVNGQTIGVTASFGVAALDSATRDSDTLLKNAEAALGEAKAAGRNRSVAWRSREPEQGAQRRRVLKAGQILFNNRASSIDCTVRSLSDEGAGIDVSTTIGIPKAFDLAIRADRFEKPCHVTSRTEKHLEVAFD